MLTALWVFEIEHPLARFGRTCMGWGLPPIEHAEVRSNPNWIRLIRNNALVISYIRTRGSTDAASLCWTKTEPTQLVFETLNPAILSRIDLANSNRDASSRTGDSPDICI
ncbi:hypothetical protein VNO77_03034 [Canavalia gladiata]|uniref:Uncharacterized protein n=1 Tax=Canavalia gladiata TaxID=3824 RepID=A0AAN9R6K7_CANGL